MPTLDNTANGPLTPEQQRQMELLRVLGEIGGSLFAEDDILHEGDKLIIPTRMDKPEAAKYILESHKREEEPTLFSRSFPYRPYDGALACWNSLKRAFGAIGHTGTTVDTIFGPIKKAPQVLSIQTSPTTTEQVPWGDFEIPYLPGVIVTAMSSWEGEEGRERETENFLMRAAGPRKYRHQIEGLFQMVEEELRTNSLYRGKAIDGAQVPNFLDLSTVERRKVFYTAEVMAQLEANIYGPLMYAKENRILKLPLKRSVLLCGGYGTGKTLAAYLTGQVATQNGWTFLMARPGRDNLLQVMDTARLYQPAVVFFEDMDLLTAPDTATADQMTQVLDAFDGITAKGTEIMVVLTTNHKNRIHKGMLRPGRLDAVIEIGSLDFEGVKGLVSTCAPKGSLAKDIDFQAVFEAMQEMPPAYIREAIDRAIRYALSRTGGNIDNIKLATDDFVHAAVGLAPQLELMKGADEKVAAEPVGTALKAAVEESMRENLSPRVLINRR